MLYAYTDEAQLLKNSQSMRYNSLRAFQSKHTLLLTGSPLQVSFPIFPLSHQPSQYSNQKNFNYTSIKLSVLQNNVMELWSLLSLLMPSLFDSQSKEWFHQFNNINNTGGTSRDNFITKMKAILSPFMLRRLKAQVS